MEPRADALRRDLPHPSLVHTSRSRNAPSFSSGESTLLSLYNVFMHWGAIIVPPGYTSGEDLAAARYLGRRIAEKAESLAGSRVRG